MKLHWNHEETGEPIIDFDGTEVITDLSDNDEKVLREQAGFAGLDFDTFIIDIIKKHTKENK